MVKINNDERIKLVSNLVELQNQPSNIQKLTKVLLEKDNNLDVYVVRWVG